MKDSKECPKKYCLLKWLAVFVFLIIYDNVMHHHLLRGMYQQTGSLWRHKEEMKAMMPWVLGHYVLLSLLIVCFYAKCRKACMADYSSNDAPCPFKHGIYFGTMLGLFMALLQACVYFHMPIPLELETAWFLGAVVKGIGIGLILGSISAWKMKSCGKK